MKMKLSEVALKSKKTLKYSQKKFTNYYYMPQDREYWPMTLKDHVTRNIDKDKSKSLYYRSIICMVIHGVFETEFSVPSRIAVDISDGTQWRGTELTCACFLCKS